jgi:hypothetical protein
MQLPTPLKYKITRYLGYPIALYKAQNPLLNNFLINDYEVEEVSIFEELVENIERVKDKIDCIAEKTAGVQDAGTDDPKFFKIGVINDLFILGKRSVTELSIATGLPVVNNIFGQSGVKSPNWLEKQFQSSGPGNWLG